MGGICYIGESMRNLSDLIAKHEEIYGDQSQRITYLPSMSELRMTNDENNRVRCIEKSKKWNKDNPNARKLIVERHKHKGKSCQWTSQKNK